MFPTLLSPLARLLLAGSHHDDVQWVTYWLIFGGLTFVESLVSVVASCVTSPFLGSSRLGVADPRGVPLAPLLLARPLSLTVMRRFSYYCVAKTVLIRTSWPPQPAARSSFRTSSSRATLATSTGTRPPASWRVTTDATFNARRKRAIHRLTGKVGRTSRSV